jgi:ABC-type glycerol-3-phosphate transport system substrate-binding protein
MRGDRWLAPEQYVGNALEAGRVQGRQLALPLMAYAEGLLYDGAAFRDAGLRLPHADWRRSDLLDAAQRLTRPGRWGLVPTGSSPNLCTLAWQNGARLVDGQPVGVDLTEPGTLEALRFVGDLVHRHRVAPRPDDAPDPPWTMLTQGSVAMIGLHAGGLAGWRSPVRPWVELAAWPAAGDRNVTLGYAPLMVGVLKSVPDRDHAFEGLRALAQAGAETMLLPPRRTDDLRSVNQALSSDDATALAGLLDIARFLPGDVPMFRVAPTIERLLLQPVLRGTKRAEAAVDQAQAEVDRILRAFFQRV